MTKKALILPLTLLIFLSAGAGFWQWESLKRAEVAKQEEKQKQIQEEKKDFVVNVDPDVNHWQTKETEFFTINFPKEWYWLESDTVKHGYLGDSGRENVITNNSSFDVDKYIGIGRGTEDAPLIIKDNNEIVVSFYGTATSNAGTAQQIIEFWFQKIKKKYIQAMCEHLSDSRNVPVVASCIFTNENHQKVQAYIVANEKNAIFISAQTTKDTLVKKETLDKLVESIVLK